MNRKSKILITLVIVSWFALVLAYYLHNSNFAVLNPKGTIAGQQRSLIVFAALLSLFVVVPVFTMTAYISLKYREGNPKKARYDPEFDHHRLIEAVWWGVPLILIAILSVVTWRTSHSLDPFKPISSNKPPLTIQVVALQWKWLFIFPEQKIASVNFAQVPVDRPLKFVITSDAPMNAFWVPNLGGQVYAMSGMSSDLNLLAEKPGDYPGVSANVSGKGFADMKFIIRAGSVTDFDSWVRDVQNSGLSLNQGAYNQLARQGTNKKPVYYGSVDDSLYNKVIMKYMGSEGRAQPAK